jgi:hypothetical protein
MVCTVCSKFMSPPAQLELSQTAARKKYKKNRSLLENFRKQKFDLYTLILLKPPTPMLLNTLHTHTFARTDLLVGFLVPCLRAPVVCARAQIQKDNWTVINFICNQNVKKSVKIWEPHANGR